jgi:aminocarboxymuconate-semialdehyde decarboxylase
LLANEAAPAEKAIRPTRREGDMKDAITNRRSFLLGAAAAAGAGYLASRIGPAIAPAQAQGAARKQVMVAGKRVRVIDIHAHLVIPKSGELLAGTNVKGDYPRAQIMGPERFARMDARGIDMQVLSINQFWWYTADRDLAAKIVRVHDEGIAEWCKANSQRFVGLTSPALQHPDLAAEQLDYAVKNLGLKGASIGGNVMGEMPSSQKYDPFWRKAEELQVPVFMHPTNGDYLAQAKVFEGRGDLGNIVGNPFETTLFLTKLIFDGVFDRFPRLKVCGAHGGGYLPSYFGRTEVTCDVRANAMCANKKRPSEYLKNNIMADCMVFSDEGLRHMVAEMGAGQIVYGSDMPFNWPDTIDIVVNAKWLSDADKEAILGGNLVRMLKI